MVGVTIKFTGSQVEELVKEPVVSFEVSEGCKDGDGVAGELCSIGVKTVSGKDIHLIYKSLNLEDPMQTNFAKEHGSFRVESTFYKVVAPLLEKLLQSRNYSTDLAQILPIPTHYSSEFYGKERNDDYICLEDLRPSGYKMVDKFAGLNFEEASIVLKKIAEFHAFTYLLIKWHGEQIFENELKEIRPFNEVEGATFAVVFTRAMQNTIQLIEKNNPILAEKLKSSLSISNVPKIREELPTTFKTDVKFFPVLTHGDLWVNNILLKYADGSNNPVDVKFIDFQLVRRGNIFEELQYFIFTSTTPELRKKHLQALLNTYYDSFQSTLKNLNFPGPANFTKGFFMDNFMECYLPGFKFLSFALPMQLGTPKNKVIEMMAGAAGPPAHGNEHSNGSVTETREEEPKSKSENNTTENDHEKFLAGFLMMLRVQMETSPRALQRFESVAQEMFDLGVL